MTREQERAFKDFVDKESESTEFDHEEAFGRGYRLAMKMVFNRILIIDAGRRAPRYASAELKLQP